MKQLIVSLSDKMKEELIHTVVNGDQLQTCILEEVVLHFKGLFLHASSVLCPKLVEWGVLIFTELRFHLNNVSWFLLQVFFFYFKL